MNWIKSKIVMLPSNKVEDNGQLFLDTRTSKHQLVYSNTSISTGTRQKEVEPQHLYFTSEEEIKDGDWFINDDGLWQCTGGIIPTGLNPRKIVATTDPNLKLSNGDCTLCNGVGQTVVYGTKAGCPLCDNTGGNYKKLPKPSQDFIKEYCDKGGIDEVEIEYEFIHADRAPGGFERFIKVNESNEINIKSIKDSWTREEHVYGIKKLRDFLFINIDLDNLVIDIYKETDKWIKENL
jgi:hypothetical protein